MPVSDTRVGQGKPTTGPAADQADGRNLKAARWVSNSACAHSLARSLAHSLRASRCSLVSTRCYRARDAFYACVEKDPAQNSDSRGAAASSGASSSSSSSSCEALRAAYEGACQASWVRHFESQREKEQQVYRRIQAAIGEGGKREGTRGGLQGSVA